MDGIFDSILQRLEKIQGIIDLSQEEMDLLKTHTRVKHEVLEVDGEQYPAWRCVHNNALGPGKGGIRYHVDVSEDEVKSLSFWMSMKNSLSGLPYGGGKGGIKFDPKSKTPEQIEAISRAFIDKFHTVLGQDKDIPAPDVYTNAQIMGWMLDQYEKNVGHHEPGMITGKPLELGGCPLRGDATARGGFIVTEEMVDKMGLDRSKLTIAVQGFGNAGHFMAMMMQQAGYKVVAVSDSSGGLHNADGIEVEKVLQSKKSGTSVNDFDGGTKITNQELLELDVDILVLAALENQVTKDNADKIKAKYIIELANGPVTPEADEILFKNGTTVVPDILANSGGVVVSYFEWAQNRTGNILDLEYLKEKLITMMKESWNKVYDLYLEYGEKGQSLDMRTAAYIIAIQRILKAEKFRGHLK